MSSDDDDGTRDSDSEAEYHNVDDEGSVYEDSEVSDDSAEFDADTESDYDTPSEDERSDDSDDDLEVVDAEEEEERESLDPIVLEQLAWRRNQTNDLIDAVNLNEDSKGQVIDLLLQAGRAFRRNGFVIPLRADEPPTDGLVQLKESTVCAALRQFVHTMTYHGTWTEILEFEDFQKYIGQCYPGFAQSYITTSVETFMSLAAGNTAYPEALVQVVADYIDPIKQVDIAGFAISTICTITKGLPAAMTDPRARREIGSAARAKTNYIWTQAGQKYPNRRCAFKTCVGCTHQVVKIHIGTTDNKVILCHRYQRSAVENLHEVAKSAYNTMQNYKPGEWSRRLRHAGYDIFASRDGTYLDTPLLCAGELYDMGFLVGSDIVPNIYAQSINGGRLVNTDEWVGKWKAAKAEAERLRLLAEKKAEQHRLWLLSPPGITFQELMRESKAARQADQDAIHAARQAEIIAMRNNPVLKLAAEKAMVRLILEHRYRAGAVCDSAKSLIKALRTRRGCYFSYRTSIESFLHSENGRIFFPFVSAGHFSNTHVPEIVDRLVESDKALFTAWLNRLSTSEKLQDYVEHLKQVGTDSAVTEFIPVYKVSAKGNSVPTSIYRELVRERNKRDKAKSRDDQKKNNKSRKRDAKAVEISKGSNKRRLVASKKGQQQKRAM